MARHVEHANSPSYTIRLTRRLSYSTTTPAPGQSYCSLYWQRAWSDVMASTKNCMTPGLLRVSTHKNSTLPRRSRNGVHPPFGRFRRLTRGRWTTLRMFLVSDVIHLERLREQCTFKREWRANLSQLSSHMPSTLLASPAAFQVLLQTFISV